VKTPTLALLALSLAACTSSETGPAHPTDRLSYPLEVTADPTGRIVWVVSGNFALAWRGAGVLAYDVIENRFVPELAFEVGSFPGPLSLYERDGRAVGAYIASRSEDRVYAVTFGGNDPTRPTVSCPGSKSDDAPDTILECPDEDAISRATITEGGDDFDLVIGDDPFGSLVRKSRHGDEPDLLLIGGMADGLLSTLSLETPSAPALVGSLELSEGLFAFAENPATGRIYASSKLSSSISILEIVDNQDNDLPDPINRYLSLAGTIPIPEPALARDRARDLAVSHDGTRLYLTYRAADMLLVVDIAEDDSGKPRGRVIHKIAMSNDPGDIVVRNVGGRDLLYVSCHKANRVEVVDPQLGEVVASIKTGAGPSGMALIDRPDLGLQRLFVALFSDDALGVIELDESSPFYHTEIAEIR
jgi:DNA-binding beta-propeller fold protein YncE